MSQGGEKTEQPTSKKLRDARKKGQVAKSQEISTTAVVVVMFVYLWFGRDFISEHVKTMILAAIQVINEPFRAALGDLGGIILTNFFVLLAPMLALVIAAALLSNLMQTGVLLAFEKIKPDLKKINPQQWFKKVFDKKNLLDFCKSLIKILFISFLLQRVIQSSLDSLTKAPIYGMNGVLTMLGAMFFEVLTYCAAAYITLAVIDYLLQKRLYIKELMMSKDEVKREYKEMEGDPIIKSQRRQMHQEMAMGNSADMKNVKKSSVVVSNPTHLAIALYYDEEETALPLVMAKGQDHVAKRIIKTAVEAGIPVMRNIPLAHQLWERAEYMEYIPSDLIEPVAEVLQWVNQISGRE